jgi:hypothetical protein
MAFYNGIRKMYRKWEKIIGSSLSIILIKSFSTSLRKKIIFYFLGLLSKKGKRGKKHNKEKPPLFLLSLFPVKKKGFFYIFIFLFVLFG